MREKLNIELSRLDVALIGVFMFIGIYTSLNLIKDSLVSTANTTEEATSEVESVTEDPVVKYHLYDIVQMNVSAYCPCEKCCGVWADKGWCEGKRVTASGAEAKGKMIAAPRNYDFGTVMEVPGYGVASVEDRGGAIKGNKIDLLFPSHQEALEWGRQLLPVKVYR